MNKKWFWLISVIAISLIVISLLIYLGTKNKKRLTSSDSPVKEEVIVTPEGRFQKVKLFFIQDSSQVMTPVPRDFLLPEAKEEKYRQFLELLFKGAEGYIVPVPENAALIQVYFLEKPGALILDFQDDLLARFPSGTDSEAEFIYFIVDNLCYNFSEVKKVAFLFGGDQHKTLSGHLDLEKAFKPDFSLLANE